MTIQSRLSAAMEKILDRAGTQIRIQYFTSTIGSVWDDDITWTQSGADLWTSGIFLPLRVSNQSSDSILLEQGKLLTDDKRLYLHGSLALTGSEMQVTIRIGSPGNNFDNQYSMLPNSIKYSVSNSPIYKLVYIRQVGGTGSLLGE